MAIEEALQTVSAVAGADLSTKQYHFVKKNSSNLLVANGDGQRAYGVLQDKPDASGKAACVAIGGISKVVAGAAVTVGAEVASDTNGRAVTAGTGDVVLGIANETSANNGEVISVRLY